LLVSVVSRLATPQLNVSWLPASLPLFLPGAFPSSPWRGQIIKSPSTGFFLPMGKRGNSVSAVSPFLSPLSKASSLMFPIPNCSSTLPPSPQLSFGYRPLTPFLHDVFCTSFYLSRSRSFWFALYTDLHSFTPSPYPSSTSSLADFISGQRV